MLLGHKARAPLAPLREADNLEGPDLAAATHQTGPTDRVGEAQDSEGEALDLGGEVLELATGDPLHEKLLP
jgi:hypothetical protein